MNNQSSNVGDLEYKPIPQLIKQYFFPAFAGVVINSLYNIVDRIFIGQAVGANALAGLSSIFPIMVIMMAFGMLVGAGGGVRVSLNLGKKDFKRAEQVLGNSFVLLIIMSVIISIIGFTLREPMLLAFGVDEKTHSYALDYLNIILLGTTFNVVGYGMNNIIRAEGSANVAMLSMLISAGMNIVLDYVFIVLFKKGVEGAALATVISQIVLCVWVVYHFRGNKSVIKLKGKMMKLKKDIISYIFTIGFAPFSMQLVSSAVFFVYNYQLMQYSNDLALSAMGVIMSVAMLMVMTIISINMAIQPIISFNFEAKHFGRVYDTLRIAVIFATVVSCVAWGLVHVFPEQIIRTFNRDSDEMLEIGVRGIRIFTLVFPLIGFQIIIGNYYQAIGKAGLATLLSLLRQAILLIPLLLTIPQIYGLDGVWMSTPIADTLAAIVCSFFLVREFRKLKVLRQEYSC
ncbi:MAG: MATE family efflux transporter [Bacteroidales bacterium]